MNKLKKAVTSISNVSVGTWIRLALLVVSMLNMALIGSGVKILPIDNEEVVKAVSGIFAAVSALAAYWKNNSFTEAAQAADKVLQGKAEITFKDEITVEDDKQ